MDEGFIRNNSYQTLLELITEEGINASGKDEVYGCIFGRDSAITILKILNTLRRRDSQKYLDKDLLLEACKRSLLGLIALQGKEINLESGEEPGKFIHEFRKDKFDHLVNREKPWFVYPDGKLRNYDSIDSTPLALIAVYKYYKLTKDDKFILQVLPSVEKGLEWMMNYGDKDKDYLLEYEFNPKRKGGGLVVQSWTDSVESLRQKDGKFPLYPIAPVEVQGYAWLAFRLWAEFYSQLKPRSLRNLRVAKKLYLRSEMLKKRFNQTFITENSGFSFPVQGLDGRKNQISTITGNSLLLLWATHFQNGRRESILEDKFVYPLVRRSFMQDLFDKGAGIRTMSALSQTYNSGPDSYHNGSFWPKLNGMAYEGLLTWEFTKEAKMLRHASLLPIHHFKTPIELYVKIENRYSEYRNERGQTSCKKQAWSAASILDLVV